MKLTIDVLGQKEVVGVLSRARFVASQKVRAAINATAMAVQTDAKRRCPVDTGRLRASIRTSFYEQGLAAEIFTDVVYAAAVEFGSGLHGPNRAAYEIRPKTARALAWPRQAATEFSPGRGKGRALFQKKGGASFGRSVGAFTKKASEAQHSFAKRVLHPGVRPRPFLHPAWEAQKAPFLARLEEALVSSFEGAA